MSNRGSVNGVCRVSDQPLEDHRLGKDVLAKPGLKGDLVLAGLGGDILDRFFGNTICLWLSIHRMVNMGHTTPILTTQCLDSIEQRVYGGLVVRLDADLRVAQRVEIVGYLLYDPWVIKPLALDHMRERDYRPTVAAHQACDLIIFASRFAHSFVVEAGAGHPVLALGLGLFVVGGLL